MLCAIQVTLSLCVMANEGTSDGMEVGAENVIRMNVRRVNYVIEVTSPCKIINGIPFFLKVSQNYPHDLNVMLRCNDRLMKMEVWECGLKGEAKLLCPANDALSIRETFQDTFGSNHINRSPFLTRDDRHPIIGNERFIVDGMIMIEVKITVKGDMKRFRKRRQIVFFTPSKYSDLVLIVDGKCLHVSKQILAHASPYFDILLFGKNFHESQLQSDEMAIDDVPFEASFEFLPVLQLIYGTGKVHDKNVESVLRIADRFTIPTVLISAESWLMGRSEVPFHRQLLLSERYNMRDLQTLLLRYSSPLEDDLPNSPSYVHYSEQLRQALRDALVDERSWIEENEIMERFKSMPETNFNSPSSKSNVVLIVDGRRFHANKQILANASSYLESLFYDDVTSQENEFIIGDVSSDGFLLVLEMIYNVHLAVADESVESILKTAAKLKLMGLLDRVEHHLIKDSELKTHVILQLTEQHNLLATRMYRLRNDIISLHHARDIVRSASYPFYSLELKAMILERIRYYEEEELDQ